MSTSLASGTYPRAGHLPALGRRGRTGFLGHLWSGLQSLGMARAAPQLRHLAFQVESGNPELARRLRDTADGLRLDDRG